MLNRVLPPVIRLFISSTFADMNRERQYFNAVLVPELTRRCMDRGVSFFNVDLRWGITEEDQMSGNVVPICLREIDNCRPFFIGILGNRYGSTLTGITDAARDAFPWLNDQMGKSVTELEMYYGVLRSSAGGERSNCAFFFRSDALSDQFYPEPENEEKQEKLGQLKRTIRQNERIPSYDYDSLEEFGQKVLSVVSNWLDQEFPSVESAREARKNWYNNELLRDFVDLKNVQEFLDNYCVSSTRSLMITGKGLRGKTTALTAWTPKEGEKILINCGADEEYKYWPAVAHEIISKLCDLDESVGFPDFHAEASLYFMIFGGIGNRDSEGDDSKHSMYYVTDGERESFRRGFVAWLRSIKPIMPVYIVINDLNLMSGSNADHLNWLPEETEENVHLICSSNDDVILENAQAMSWNMKEIPLFSDQDAAEFLDGYMSIFGKGMSAQQKGNLLSSPLLRYPGYLKFIIRYFNNYGNFSNLDQLTETVGNMSADKELYSFMLDSMLDTLFPEDLHGTRTAMPPEDLHGTQAAMPAEDLRGTQTAASIEERQATLPIEDIHAAQTALYILGVSSIGLREDDLYALIQKLAPVSTISWSRIRVIFEQFQLITADTWSINDKKLCSVVHQFPVDGQKIHQVLADFFFDHMGNTLAHTSEEIRHNTEYAKAVLEHCAEAKDWDLLAARLQNWHILYYLSKMEWSTVRSMWMRLLIFSDIDVQEKLMQCFHMCENEYQGIEGIQQRFINLMSDLELWDIAEKASQEAQLPKSTDLRHMDVEDFSDESREFYNHLADLKDQREFMRMRDEVYRYLEMHEGELNQGEKCAFYMMKQDSEEHIGDSKSALETTYLWYAAAVASMNDYDILRSVLARATLLYFSGQFSEAAKTLDYCRRLALNLGDIREFLSVTNVTGMYSYRVEHFNESLECFELCMKAWKRLGNDRELASCWMNKCNALYLSGDAEAAAREAEILFHFAEDLGKGYEDAAAKALGNMGFYLDELGKKEEAERAMVKALELARGKDEETPTDYTRLIEHYKNRQLFGKAIEINSLYVDFLYERRLYPELAAAVKNGVDLMQLNSYTHEAREFQEKWETVFSHIPGGRELLDSVLSEDTDPFYEDRIKEDLIVARSENNHEKCGELLFTMAELAGGRKEENTCSLFLQAMDAFTLSGNTDRSADCAVRIIDLLIDSGYDDPRFEKACALLSLPEREIIEEWLRFRSSSVSDVAYTKGMIGILEKPVSESRILAQCLIHETGRMIEKLPEGMLFRIMERMKEDPRHQEFAAALHEAISEDFYKEIDELKGNYTGQRADHLLGLYEKKIAVLDAMGEKDAGAFAGNIALIYRRRRDREETIRYHEMASRIYRDHNETRDMFIEQMNLATAYREFGEMEKCLEQLRSILRDPQIKAYDDIRAAVAGNLASFLVHLDDSSYESEIIECFGIEEAYYQKAGEARELVISLINQLTYYLTHRTGDKEVLREKYLQAEKLTEEHHLREFTQALRKIKPLVLPEQKPQSEKTSKYGWLFRKLGKKDRDSEKRENAKGFLQKLINEESYHEIAETSEETETHIHALLYLKEEIMMMKVNAHLWIDCADTLSLRYLLILQAPAIHDKMNVLIRQYRNWWNEQGDYGLDVQEEDDGTLVLTQDTIESEDPEKIVQEFRRIERFWMADVLNISMCMIGMDDIGLMKETKMKIMG